jgi:hypothetical protein
VRLKVGYTRTAVFPLPDSVRAFLVKPTLMYLYGVELDKVRALPGPGQCWAGLGRAGLVGSG